MTTVAGISTLHLDSLKITVIIRIAVRSCHLKDISKEAHMSPYHNLNDILVTTSVQLFSFVSLPYLKHLKIIFWKRSGIPTY